MKKILLVTIQDQSNYGNRLQNYALQTVLKDLGCSVDNLTTVKNYGASVSAEIKMAVKRVLVKLGRTEYNQQVAIDDRRKGCIAFTKRYLPDQVYTDRHSTESEDWNQYDYAVVGSDQVWHNWKRVYKELSYYYLEFMPHEKRVSYAPSFGFREFPQEDLAQHRNGLLGMKTLSCREQEGCSLIHSLTDRDAVKVLDPTLLLNRAEWLGLERRPGFDTGSKYLLKFFLGTVHPDYQEEIDRIAADKGLNVIYINNRQDPARYGISPEQFIWLINHADTVCTDSFHGSVFSILFGKDLRVFRRNATKNGDMFGRLTDLLAPLGLMDNVFGIGNKLSTQLSSEAKEYLDREKENSIGYLARSLEIDL